MTIAIFPGLSRLGLLQALLGLGLTLAAIGQMSLPSRADTVVTATDLKSDLNPSAPGQSVTFTATITAFGGGAPTGTATFSEGATTLGTGPVDTAGVGYVITAGSAHTCALTSAGGVKCWGFNVFGQLGDGTSTQRPVPAGVSGLTSGIAAIEAGYEHTCALTSAGGVKCWGNNGYGQLGNGATTHSSSPVDVTGLTSGVSAIAAGWNFTCALTSTGGVKCWGRNGLYGQLGDGTAIDNTAPVDVSGLTSGVIAIAAGYDHTCALTSAGGIKCWGNNFYGQLGDDTTTTRTSPVDVSGLSGGVIAIASGYDHTCGVTSAGGVKCWGRNDVGQLGDDTGTQSLTPVDVSGLSSGTAAIVAGVYHACALSSTGGVKCWGGNDQGQLADGSTTNRLAPVVSAGLSSGTAAIAAGVHHICAVIGAGGVTCWGRNLNGQLGDGTITLFSTPTPVTGLTALTYGRATYSSAALSGGNHDITAAYGGDPGHDASTSPALTQVVTLAATTTALDSSQNPSVFGQSVTFTATVSSGSGTPTGTVTFKDGGSTLGNGTLSAGAAAYSTSALAVSGHTITAVYDGDGNFATSTSSDLAQTVNKGTTATAHAATVNQSTPGQSIGFTATVTVTAPATGTPTGTVTFKEGATTLGTGILSAGTATFSTAALTIGSHTITANYAGTSDFAVSMSSASVTVDPKTGAGAAFRVNASGTNSQQQPSVAQLSSNGFVVTWASNLQDGSGYGIYSQRYNAVGTKTGSEFRVNTATAGDQSQPSAAKLTNGFIVTWQSINQDGSGLGIYAQRYSNAGVKTGIEFRVNTATARNQSQPSVAGLSGGGFVVAWTSQDQDGSGLGVYAQRYSNAGAKAGNEFLVNTVTNNDQSSPSVAALTGGGFVIAWQSDGQDTSSLGVYGQRYSTVGAKVGNEFRVNATLGGAQSLPAAAGLLGGGFVVAWQGPDTSGLGVYGQRYGNTGAKTGGEFRVNTATASDQSQPSVAAFADGGFVVTWTSNGQDGSGLGVYGQAYSAAGTRAHIEFRVNTVTANNQWQPSVVAFSAGSFMTAWTSKNQDGSLEGVYGQRFKMMGVAADVASLAAAR